MITHVLIIHGYLGRPESGWIPTIRTRLESKKIQVTCPQLPGDMYPDHEQWTQVLLEGVKEVDPQNVLIISHSLGTRATLLFLQEYAQQVAGVVLVGAFANDLSNATFRGGNYANFFEKNIDLQAMKKLSCQWAVLHSVDDDRIPVEQGKRLAKDLSIEPILVKGYRHFTSPQSAGKVWEAVESFL